jgi:hypothetical protein
MTTVRFWVACSILVPVSVQAGILVTRSDKTFQFTEAGSIVLNGKEKVLALGPSPKSSGPNNKLPNLKLANTLIKDVETGAVAIYEDGALNFIIPEGLPKTAPADPVAIWKTVAHIAYKKAANDKQPTEVPITSFVAYLTGGTEELARLCRDMQGLALIGGKDKAVATQMEFMAAVAKAYPTDASVATLERYIEQAMRQRYDQFESGTANVAISRSISTPSPRSRVCRPRR